MQWLAFALLIAFLAFLGFYAALGLTIIVTSLVEKRPIRPLRPADPDDPERSALEPIRAEGAAAPAPGAFNPYQAPGTRPYAQKMNDGAAKAGFSDRGLFVNVNEGLAKVHATLWLSPARDALALISWGTVAKITADKTMLISDLGDGRVLITSDGFAGNEAPGFDEPRVLPGADFERLAGRHSERLRLSGGPARPFESEDALAILDQILERRARFLVDRGDAYYVDAGGRPGFRSTLKGALKLYGRTFRASQYVERTGADGRLLPAKPSYPAPLAWADRLFTLTMLLSLFLNYRGAARTPGQLAFRLGLIGFSLVGWVTVAILKVIYKRRASPPTAAEAIESSPWIARER
jgi:hypothetical protein